MTTPPQRDELPGDEGEFVAVDDAVIGRALRTSAIALVVLAAGVGGALWWGSRVQPLPAPTPTTLTPALEQPSAPEIPALPFTDVTLASGIDFVHENGARGEKLLPETMGAGCAFVDVEGDGDADILFNNGTIWPHDTAESGPPATPRLYLNDGKGRFADATAGSRLDEPLYGTGLAVGDDDGDGDIDVLLCALGPNRLLRNDGQGRFVDVTDSAGVAGDPRDWSTSAAFFDLENDGDLDLFVANYVRWTREVDLALDFRLVGVGRAYGPPMSFEGTHSVLLRNDGTGGYTDVSAAAGVQVTNPATGGPVGKGLGVAPVDLGADALVDLVVANDTVANFLFRNNGDGSLAEIGATSGLAYDSVGKATGAMGVDVADFRNEDVWAAAIGNFANEMTSLYVADGDPFMFADVARVEGIGAPSRSALSFGVLFVDVDLDGRLDLFQTNGHLEQAINTVQPSQHYRQPSQLFWNAGPDARATYLEVESSAVGDLAQAVVGRGAARADIDGDGDSDLLITQSGERPLLLRNDQTLGHHWLRVRLVGRPPNTGALGARVELTAGGVTQRRQVFPSRSYLSQVELALTFGLGAASAVDALLVHWPDGTRSAVAVDEVDRLLVVEQPTG